MHTVFWDRKGNPPVWSPQIRKDVEFLNKAQRRATKIIRALKHLSNEIKLRKLGFFGLEKKKLTVFKGRFFLSKVTLLSSAKSFFSINHQCVVNKHCCTSGEFYTKGQMEITF